MTSDKILWIAGLIIVALGVAVFFGLIGKPGATPTPQLPQEVVQTYNNAQYGIAFEYPTTYKLEERADAFEGSPILVITLIEKNTVVPDASEGPTAISIIAVPNASSTPLSDWVQAKSISNFALSPDKALATTTFMGNPAALYRYSGLYENDAVAMSHGDKIYLFAASWTTPEQPIRHDFQQVVESVKFI